jgi:glycosyltransferase involved in cell wall biosynthesis
MHPIGAGEGGYAVFLGRMSPDKGVHTAALVARAAGMPLRIAAKMWEPAERAYFHEQVEPLLGNGVEYVGEVGLPARLELLRDAVCLLNPIDWDEPFGMVMVEAMACGTPIVATPRGSTPELIDEGSPGSSVTRSKGWSLPSGRSASSTGCVYGRSPPSVSRRSGWLPSIWSCTVA